jgi:hypothetical protein
VFLSLLFAQILLPTAPIELEWQHLKKDELSGQVFDLVEGVGCRFFIPHHTPWLTDNL